MKLDKFVLWILILLGLVGTTGCIQVTYSDTQRELSVTSFRPFGEQINLEAMANEIGSITVDRTQGSAVETVEAVGEAVDRNIGL